MRSVTHPSISVVPHGTAAAADWMPPSGWLPAYHYSRCCRCLSARWWLLPPRYVSYLQPGGVCIQGVTK
jgi:hypothetical protein